MTINWNIILQICLLLVQIVNLLAPILTGNWKVVGAAAVAALQGTISIIAHYYTPQGTVIPKESAG
jgi:hypothetical protein